MKNIFLDFDGLQFDTVPAQVDFINQHFGISVTPDEFKKHSNILETLISRHTGKEVSRRYVYSEFFDNFLKSHKWHENVEPFLGMTEVVSALSKKYRLYTVTARQSGGIDVIKTLTENHIPGCISHIHCVWEMNKEGEYTGISKIDFIRRVHGEHHFFIDDSLHEIEKVHNEVPSILFDPYSEHEDYSGQRVVSWKEIGQLLI